MEKFVNEIRPFSTTLAGTACHEDVCRGGVSEARQGDGDFDTHHLAAPIAPAILSESNFFRNYYRKKLLFSPKGNFNPNFDCKKLPANKNKQLYIASNRKKVAFPLKKQPDIASSGKKVALLLKKKLCICQRDGCFDTHLKTTALWHNFSNLKKVTP